MRHVIHLAVIVDAPDTATLDDTVAMLRRRLDTPDADTGGDEIRIARVRAGVAQAELARQLGVSASYLSLMESSNRRISDDMRTRLEAALPAYADGRWQIRDVQEAGTRHRPAGRP